MIKAVTLRKKDLKTLEADLLIKQKELSDVQFDMKVGKEKDVTLARKLRKEIAKILTIINELHTMKLVEKSGKIDDSLKKTESK